MADEKISAMTPAVLGNLGATSTAIEASTGLPGAPVTLSVSFGLLAQWLSTVGAVVAPVTKAFANTPYAVAATDETILVDTSAGNVQVTLPAAPTAGRVLNIKKITTDGNTLTIARNGKTIEGAAANLTTASSARPNYTLQYDATAGSWWVL